MVSGLEAEVKCLILRQVFKVCVSFKHTNKTTNVLFVFEFIRFVSMQLIKEIGRLYHCLLSYLLLNCS